MPSGHCCHPLALLFSVMALLSGRAPGAPDLNSTSTVHAPFPQQCQQSTLDSHNPGLAQGPIHESITMISSMEFSDGQIWVMCPQLEPGGRNSPMNREGGGGSTEEIRVPPKRNRVWAVGATDAHCHLLCKKSGGGGSYHPLSVVS